MAITGNIRQLQERERIMDTLKKIEKLLHEAHGIKQTHRERMSKLNAERTLWSEEEFEKRKKKLENEKKALLNDGYLRMTEALKELIAELETLDKQAPDLKNTELVHALRIIEMTGETLSYEQLSAINNCFIGQFGNLKAIHSLHEKKKMVNNGGIEKLLLSSAPNLDKLNEYAYSLYHQEGSINEMARQVGKIAELVAQPFQTNIDGSAFERSIRSGAGLPEEK